MRVCVRGCVCCMPASVIVLIQLVAVEVSLANVNNSVPSR